MRHCGERASPEAWREPLLGGLVSVEKKDLVLKGDVR